MSQQNAPLTREHVEALVRALNARDFGAITELPFWDPAVRFRSVIGAAEGDTYVGIEGIRSWAKNSDATWENFRVRLVDFRAASEDRFVVLYHATGVARTSGVPLDTHTAQVWTLREGKVVRNESYSDPREALEAVGLSE